MAAAPVNPSDLARIRHLPVSERKTFIAGIEGCGTVVGYGNGIIPYLWMGKRVACSANSPASGTWADYLVTSAMACVPLPSAVSDEQGSMLLVNPLTSVAFIKIARARNHQAIINTAAASALGRILEHLATKNGIHLIQIVRNEQQKVALVTRGAVNVLDSSDSRFENNLQALAKKFSATLAFDAVGGEMTGRLLRAIPFGGSVIVYGNLSGEQPMIDHRSLVTENKKVEGFYLVNWHRANGILKTLASILEARNILKNHISIPIQATFSLVEVRQAIDTYLGSMSQGKVILMP
jgi:NADPH2:quinone reductase